MYKVPYGVIERKVEKEPEVDLISEQIFDMGRLAALEERMSEIDQLTSNRWTKLFHFAFDTELGHVFSKAREYKMPNRVRVPLTDEELKMRPADIMKKFNVSFHRAYSALKKGFVWQSVVLAIVLSLNGCILAAMNDPSKAMLLTPEQIKAYQELNVDIVLCLNVGGPPPAGNSIFLLLPKDSKMIPQFIDSCHIAPNFTVQPVR